MLIMKDFHCSLPRYIDFEYKPINVVSGPDMCCNYSYHSDHYMACQAKCLSSHGLSPMVSLVNIGKVPFQWRVSPCGHCWGLLFWLPLQWRHNEHDGVSNHQPYGFLLNCLFMRRSKKTSRLRVTGLCDGNSPVTGEFPSQRASNAENVSIWWRHHGHFFGDRVAVDEIWGIRYSNKFAVIWYNSWWSIDAIWRHKSGSTFAQVMACCLTAPSH